MRRADFLNCRCQLTDHPAELRKKVQLLEYFKSYLDNTAGSADGGRGAARGDDVRASSGSRVPTPRGPLPVHENGREVVPHSRSATSAVHDGLPMYSAHGQSTREGVSISGPWNPFVRYWLRTKSAIVFVLDDGTVQCNFVDHCKIILAPTALHITVIDKRQKAAQMTCKAAICSEVHDLVDRLFTCSRIVEQLVTREQQRSGHLASPA